MRSGSWGMIGLLVEFAADIAGAAQWHDILRESISLSALPLPFNALPLPCDGASLPQSDRPPPPPLAPSASAASAAQLCTHLRCLRRFPGTEIPAAGGATSTRRRGGRSVGMSYVEERGGGEERGASGGGEGGFGLLVLRKMCSVWGFEEAGCGRVHARSTAPAAAVGMGEGLYVLGSSLCGGKGGGGEGGLAQLSDDETFLLECWRHSMDPSSHFWALGGSVHGSTSGKNSQKSTHS